MLFKRLIFAILSFAPWAPAALAQAVDPSCYGANITAGVVCPGEGVDPLRATTTPAAHAWMLFAEINQPAFPGNASDTRRVWETWKNEDDNREPAEAVYLDNGHAPQVWNVAPRLGPVPKQLVANQQLAVLRQRLQASKRPTVLFVPLAPEGQETRINRPGFNFILANELYNKQGQYKFASQRQNFDFPAAAKEIKGAWTELTAGMDATKYYTATSGGKTYALVAMHVITKDLPFWFWSSFVHKDQTKPGPYDVPLDDSQPVPTLLRGTVFENYRLLAELRQVDLKTLVKTGQGAQLDWITRTGEATVLGNPQIESGFETISSCVTCHSQASIGKDQQGNIFHNEFRTVVGPTKPELFKDGDTVFFPLDFLWSMSRASDFKP